MNDDEIGRNGCGEEEMNGSESGNAYGILNDVCGSVNDDDIVIDVGNGDITVELDERQMDLV